MSESPPSSSDPEMTTELNEAEGLVRLIVESFRDAPNPSVDIAVEEIMRTFADLSLFKRRETEPQVSYQVLEKCPTCSAPAERIRGRNNGLPGASKIASADSFRYAPPLPPESVSVSEPEMAHIIKKLRQNYPTQGCDVCDRLLAKLGASRLGVSSRSKSGWLRCLTLIIPQ